jgi:hypothetical protein
LEGKEVKIKEELEEISDGWSRMSYIRGILNGWY